MSATMLAMRHLLAALLLVPLLDGCGEVDPERKLIEQAGDRCVKVLGNVGQMGAARAIQVSGNTVVIDSGRDGADVQGALAAVECVLDKLDAPATVTHRMGETSAADGRQSEKFNGVRFGWSYQAGDVASFEATFDPA